MHDAVVDDLHVFEMTVQFLQEPVRTRPGHTAGNTLQLLRVQGKSMGLTIFFKLKPVLQVAKELVGVDEARVFGWGQKIAGQQAGQGQKRPGMTNISLTATMQTLETLHQKFNIADAATGQLYVDDIFR